MAIINTVSMNNLFWDSRVSGMLELSLRPVFDHIEMGMINSEMLVSRIQNISYYPELFKKAFGEEEITEEKIAIALTHFVNSMFSQDSKLDKVAAGQGTELTPLEAVGREIFNGPKALCSNCHAGINASAPDFPGGRYGPRFNAGPSEENPRGTANIGLDEVYRDNGRGNGKFRIPSLRNIALTAPYMHDGRFKTLEEVIDHYDRGVKAHPHLDDIFKDANGKVIRLNLTDFEKRALVDFLKAFTDESLITDPKFSDPFIHP
jgi:cytochrome c peroxidase